MTTTFYFPAEERSAGIRRKIESVNSTDRDLDARFL